METKKILAIIFSLIFLALFGFVLSWGIINFNKVKEGMSGTELYTNEDLKNSYQDGYDTALKDKVEYEELINGYRDNITTLTDNISSLNSQVAALTNVNKDYQNQIKNLNEVKQLNEETIAQLNGTISLNTITIDELNSQVEALNNTKISNENTINALNKTIAENNTLISSLNAQIEEYEAEIENNEQTIEELNNQIDLLETENSNKQLEIDTLTSTNTSLNNQITNLNTLVDELQTSNDRNLATIQSLNNQISLQKAQIQELQNQQNANDVSIYELNNKITELEKSVAYYENYIFELESANHLVGIFEFNRSVYSICEADENGLVSVENPESTEFVIFNYWMVDNQQVDLSTYVLETNTKFVANITYKHKVKFIVDDEIYNEQVVIKGSMVNVPENPSKDKFTFVGWSINGVDTMDLTNYEISDNTTFVAMFIENYGLFNADTGKLIYSWDELQQYDYLAIEEGVLSSGANVKRMSGNLYIDDEVTKLNDNLFKGCSALANVYLPNSVKSIGEYAFASCTTLESIVCQDGLEEIGTYAFQYTSMLEEFVMPNTVTTVGRYLFSSSGIQKCVISNGLTELVAGMFSSCKKLTDVTVPSTITEVGNGVFYQCETLKTLDLSSVLTIDQNNFSFDYALEELILGDNIELVNSQFNSCTNLKTSEYEGGYYLGNAINPYLVLVGIADKTISSFKFHSSCRAITQAFSKCASLTYIDLPNSIIGLGYEAFASCGNLTSIDLPYTLKHIGYDAFYNCSLTELELPETVEYLGYSCFKGNDFTTLNLPDSVEIIEFRAFESCSKLTTIHIGPNSKLNFIGEDAFLWTELTSIWIPDSVETIVSGKYSRPFLHVPETFVIYCEAEEDKPGYGEEWYYDDYGSDKVAFEIHYGYSYEEYIAAIGG